MNNFEKTKKVKQFDHIAAQFAYIAHHLRFAKANYNNKQIDQHVREALLQVINETSNLFLNSISETAATIKQINETAATIKQINETAATIKQINETAATINSNAVKNFKQLN